MLKYGRICTSHGQTCQDMAKLFSITPKYGLVMPWYEQSKLSYNMKRPIYGQGKMCKDLTKKYQMALNSELHDILLTDWWVYTFEIILVILLYDSLNSVWSFQWCMFAKDLNLEISLN